MLSHNSVLFEKIDSGEPTIGCVELKVGGVTAEDFCFEKGSESNWRGKQMKGDQEKSFKKWDKSHKQDLNPRRLAPSCDSREATGRHLVSNIYQMAAVAPWSTSIPRAGASSAFPSSASD